MEFDHYREILDSWPMSILFCDMDHIIRYMNPAAEQHYYQHRSYQPLIGTNVLDYHKPETRERIYQLVEEMKAGGVEQRIGTVRGEGYRVHMMPVRDREGNMIGYCQKFLPPQDD